MGPALFVGLDLTLILFIHFIMLFVWMLNVNSIKFTFHIVLGTQLLILAISSNISLSFIYSPGLKMVNYLSITLFGVPTISVGAGLGSVKSSSFNCYKERSFFLSNSERIVVSEIILASLGYVSVHYYAATMLLYF